MRGRSIHLSCCCFYPVACSSVAGTPSSVSVCFPSLKLFFFFFFRLLRRHDGVGSEREKKKEALLSALNSFWFLLQWATLGCWLCRAPKHLQTDRAVSDGVFFVERAAWLRIGARCPVLRSRSFFFFFVCVCVCSSHFSTLTSFPVLFFLLVTSFSVPKRQREENI